MSNALITAIAAIVAAILTALLRALLTYSYTRRRDQRQARLERLNAQLEELYGPLYATLRASQIAYENFVAILRPGRTTLFPRESDPPLSTPLSDEELHLFRLWVTTVMHPRAILAYQLIIGKAHLLVRDETMAPSLRGDIPHCLLDFCAHKAGYDVLIERWKAADFTEHLSVIRHPGEPLYDYLRESFMKLKKQQEHELELIHGHNQWSTRAIQRISRSSESIARGTD